MDVFYRVLNKELFAFECEDVSSGQVEVLCDIYTEGDFGELLHVSSLDITTVVFDVVKKDGNKLIVNFEDFRATAGGDLLRKFESKNQTGLVAGRNYYIKYQGTSSIYADATHDMYATSDYSNYFLDEDTNELIPIYDYWKKYMYRIPFTLHHIDTENRHNVFKKVKGLPKFTEVVTSAEARIYDLTPNPYSHVGSFELRDKNSKSLLIAENLYTFVGDEFIKLSHFDKLTSTCEIIFNDDVNYVVHSNCLIETTDKGDHSRYHGTYTKTPLVIGTSYAVHADVNGFFCVDSNANGDIIPYNARIVDNPNNMFDSYPMTAEHLDKCQQFILQSIDNSGTYYFYPPNGINGYTHNPLAVEFYTYVCETFKLSSLNDAVAISNIVFKNTQNFTNLNTADDISKYIISWILNFTIKRDISQEELSEVFYVLNKCCTPVVAKFMYGCLSSGFYSGPKVLHALVDESLDKIDFILTGYDSLSTYLKTNP